jgi:hypothetical protein
MASRVVARLSDGLDRSRTWVLATAGALLVAQLVFRTWAAWSSWYFLDDLIFLRRFDEVSRWSYLMEPYNGHLMPGGKLVFWAIGSVGSAEWWPAVVFLVVGQAVAGMACLWMLVTLFGPRWAIVPPFVLYLFLSLTTPAYMWLVAATQQLPLQIVLSVSVGAWVRYLRGDGRWWLAVTIGALALGMVFREKALLVLPILVFISLFYFTHGGPLDRLRALRRQAVALLLVLAMGAAYLVLYRDRVPSQFSPTTPGLAGELASTMLGSTLATGLVGGPWRWYNPSPPNSFADPPAWAVSASWLVLGGVIAYVGLRRQKAWPALLLLAGYVAGTYLLVLSGRGAALGAELGTDTRYLADIPIVLCLCLGLASMRLPGASCSSEAREPALVARLPAWMATAMLAGVALGGITSSIGYIRPWHRSEAKAFFQRLDEDITARGRVDMVDRVLPEDVMSHLAAPANNFRYLAPLVTDAVHYPDVSPELAIAGDDGSLRQVVIERGVDSLPGPVVGCGWRVKAAGRQIPLAGNAFDFAWWARIGYLSSQDSPVTVSAGDTSVQTRVRSGLNNLYVRLEGGFDRVTIDGLVPGTTLCVDTVEVGQPEPGVPLP